MNNPDTRVATRNERPWRHRSPLWDRETEIRRLQAEGYSLAQIVRLLDLQVSRPTLWRFLHRADAARDGAALSALDNSGFTPPPSRSRTSR